MNEQSWIVDIGLVTVFAAADEILISAPLGQSCKDLGSRKLTLASTYGPEAFCVLPPARKTPPPVRGFFLHNSLERPANWNVQYLGHRGSTQISYVECLAPGGPTVSYLSPSSRFGPKRTMPVYSRLGFLFARRAPVSPSSPPGFEIDQMHPRAGDARKRLIGASVSSVTSSADHPAPVWPVVGQQYRKVLAIRVTLAQVKRRPACLGTPKLRRISAL